jgi:hypothetical protein
MRRIGILSVVTLGCLLAQGTRGETAEPKGFDEAVLQLRERLAEATAPRPGRVAPWTRPWQAGKAYKECSKAVGAAGLSRLRRDRDLGIALFAAWERRGLPGESDRGGPQRFLGLVEGRTRLAIPLRWEVEVVRRWFEDRPLSVQSALKPYLRVCPFVKEDPDHTLGIETEGMHRTGARLRASADTSVTAKGDFLVIRVKGAASELRLRAALVRKLGEQYPLIQACTAAIGPDVSIVAFYDLAGARFPLLCVETRTGAVKWQKEAWAVNFVGISSSALHRLDIVRTEESVGVFGHTGLCYLEVFRLKDGKPECRFTTDYWGYQK